METQAGLGGEVEVARHKRLSVFLEAGDTAATSWSTAATTSSSSIDSRPVRSVTVDRAGTEDARCVSAGRQASFVPQGRLMECRSIHQERHCLLRSQ